MAKRALRPLELNIISKYRNEIYGFSILWIVLFHGYAVCKIDFSFGRSWLFWLSNFAACGGVGVDIFLFLSGVCLYFSFCKNSDIRFFYRKRLVRIIPSTLLIFGPYWVVYYLVLKHKVVTFFEAITLTQFWITGAHAVWFVSVILVLYLVYPLIYHLMYGSGRRPGVPCVVILAVVVAAVYAVHVLAPGYYKGTEIGLTRIPVFIVGCAMGKAVYEGKQAKPFFSVAAVLVAMAFFAIIWLDIFHGMSRRYIFGLGGIALAYSLALLFKACACGKVSRAESNLKKSGHESVSYAANCDIARRPWYLRALSAVGGFSLELYLSHLVVINFLKLTPFYAEGSIAEYLLVAAAAIGIAWLVMKATAPLERRVKSHHQA